MSKWITLIATALLTWVAGCGAPASAPTPVATALPVATIAPTDAPAATVTSAPTATTATEATPTVSASTTATSSGQGQEGFVPKVRSVWNTTVSLDQMSGTCPKGSMLPVYGLVQITPADGKLAWKSQEPKPYTFTRLQPNIYQYSGPTAINDGVVTMTLTFSSTKDLSMQREFVSSADPACTHNHTYTGVFQWEKP
jgi:hypothetical protein